MDQVHFRSHGLQPCICVRCGYSFFVCARFAYIDVVDVVKAQLVELCQSSNACRSPRCEIDQFGSFDRLCRSIGIYWTTYARSPLGWLTPIIRVWRCHIILPFWGIDWLRGRRLNRLGSVFPFAFLGMSVESTLSFLAWHFVALPFSTLADSALPWLANVDLVNLLVESISTSGPLTDSELAGVLSAWLSSTVCRISNSA